MWHCHDYKVMPDAPLAFFAANDGKQEPGDRPRVFRRVECRHLEKTILNVMVELYYCHTRDNA